VRLQIVRWVSAGQVVSFTLPAADEAILPGVRWGRADVLFSSAYWAGVLRSCPPTAPLHRLTASLRDELALCLLGGFGMPAEVGLAAFAHLRGTQLLDESRLDVVAIARILREPLELGNGRRARYRFPEQKSRYLVAALRDFDAGGVADTSPLLLRNRLLRLSGVGWKTASWVARNWLGTSEVAILDIHVMRAGYLAGVFDRVTWRPIEYPALERRYLDWAAALGAPAADFDAVVWREMRSCGRLASATIKAEFPPAQCLRLRNGSSLPARAAMPKVHR
jgi:thermostable 8-oxoguanine DNA glycosylase